jgi:hypothetical protein
MSTIKVDTIQKANGTSQIGIDKIGGVTSASIVNVIAEGGSTTTNLSQGLAKMWGNYDGSGTTLDDSFGYSSATDVDAGDYDMNFTNNMATAHYAPTSTICAGGDRNAGGGGTGLQTNEFRIIVYNSGGGNEDSTEVVSSVHGDLA